MSRAPSEPRPTRLTRLLPWLRIGRAPGISLDGRKLILAAVGLLALRLGWDGIGLILPPEVGYRPFEPASWSDPGPTTNLVATAPMEPFRVLTAPFVDLFRLGHSVPSFLRALFMVAWTVIVWGLIGGAIARIAALQMGSDTRIGIWQALKFALQRSVALVGAPLSPLIGIGFFAALCAPIGLLYRLPAPYGEIVAGLLGFLPLLAGLVMTLLVAGLAVGWPLMTATVAVDDEDAFDAVSRSYSYATQRPGQYAVYAALAWCAGAIGLMIVQRLAYLVIHMARWGLDFGGPDARIAALMSAGQVPGWAASFHDFWISTVRTLAHGWIYSYFFSAAVVIYTLLRRDVDGAPYHHLGGTTKKAESPHRPIAADEVGPEKQEGRPDEATG